MGKSKALKPSNSFAIFVDRKGFSLMEIMVAIAISSIVVLGTAALFLTTSTAESTQQRQFWITARRMEFQGLIKSTPGWNNILAANPAMACFTNNTSCAAFAAPQPLRLPIDPAGAIVLNGALNTNGLTKSGDICNTFDPVAGNSSCPVGLQLQWVALCDDGNCQHAQPKIMVNFQLKETGAALQNLTSQNLVVFKDPQLESLNNVCVSMGGALNVATNTCTIASLATSCSPSGGAVATFPLGFNADGSVICGQPNPGGCAASDVATGFDVNGGLTCAPACQ